jgi:chromosome partitioning protein
MKIIALMGCKGGITKTTMTVNLAAGLARAGLRVLVVDTDWQASATTSMGIKARPGLAELVLSNHEFQEVILPVDRAFHDGSGDLFVLPTDTSNMEIERNPDTVPILYQRFGELRNWADVVLMDTSPGINELNTAMYYVSDYVLLPTTLDKLALVGLKNTFAFLKSASAKGTAAGYRSAAVLGIVPNRFSPREKVERDNKGYLHGKYEDVCHVFDEMRDLTIWKQAVQMKKSIFAYQPADDPSARRAARAAAHEIMPVVEGILQVVQGAAV